MPPFVPEDAYCMLTVTMQDLYPFDSWNFVFGWANYKARTGVFSFGRYHPSFNDSYCESGDPENELLENACYVMVHEIGHMYGMTHCTFYECIMNGFNGYEE
jgi:archaemetzincin